MKTVLTKPGIRILGIDDGPFDRNRNRQVLVVATVYRGDQFDGLLTTRVVKDGWNATSKIIRMVRGSKFWAQLHAIMIDGIALGGFNVVNLAEVHRSLGLPAMAVCRNRPDLSSVRQALGKLSRPEARWRVIEAAGPLHASGPIWFQVTGASADWASTLIARSTVQGNIPEPLRAAHLIAGGLVHGQSGRRA